MPMTTTVEQRQRAEARAAAFEALQEFKRTQPALYDAICAYGAALRLGRDAQAFDHAGEIAARVLALAAGLSS